MSRNKGFRPNNWNRKVVGKHVKGTAYDALDREQLQRIEWNWNNGIVFGLMMLSVVMGIIVVALAFTDSYETEEGVITAMSSSEYEVWQTRSGFWYVHDVYVGNGTQYCIELDNSTTITVKTGVAGILGENLPAEIGDRIRYTDYGNGMAGEVFVLEKAVWVPLE